MKRALPLIFFTFVTMAICLPVDKVLAQTGSISGRVIDSETLEALPFANVFINNTTLGVSTSVSGEFTLTNVPVGSPEVVFSFIGYKTYQTQVNVQDGKDMRLNIKLVPQKNQLEEVQVKATRDKAWEKQLKKFEKIFLGSDDLGRQCKIVNPVVVDFAETKDGSFRALASAPIIVENRALGYTVHFYLKSFTADETSYAIVGNARFEELPATSVDDAVQWTTNRKEAYLGSARHLFKAILDDRVAEEGFRLYTSRANFSVITQRGREFEKELNKNIIPFKPMNVVSGGSLYERKITLGNKVEVHYVNESTQRPVYSDIPYAVSWLEMKNGFIRTNPEGVLLNSLDVVQSGDMGLARVSNMLPLDYKAGGIVKVAGEKKVEVQRLFEKTYVHTSKAFYYPGEIIWFKAYMGYAAPDMRDTLSSVLYVDLIDAQRNVIQSRTLRIEYTIAAGEFLLPHDMKPGKYALVAYTNWMRNFGSKTYFVKPIPVLDIYERISQNDAVSANNSRELEVTTDKEKYGLRELVKVSLNLTDEAEKPVGGNFSVSVTDLTQVPVPTWVKEDIVRGLAIPAQVEVSGNRFTQRVEYGVTWNAEFIGDTRKKEKTDLTIVKGAFDEVQKVTADENGNFSLLNLDFYDSAVYSVQALKKGQLYGGLVTKKRNVPFAEFKASDYNIPIEKKETVQRVISSYEVPKDAILLEGITVRSTKLLDTTRHVPNIYGKGDVILQGDDINRMGTMEGLLRAKALGFRLNFDGTHYQLINIRGESTLPPSSMEGGGTGVNQMTGFVSEKNFIMPAFRIDRTPEPTLTIDNVVQNISSGETVGDRLMYMELSQIDRIEISSVGTSYTGSQGGYGLVAVFLKKGIPPSKLKFHQTYVKGFHLPREFNGPDYAAKAEDHSAGDYRSTLYWNRNVRVPMEGTGEFSFYTSDLPGKYRVVIEGVTFEGRPIHVDKTIQVEGN